MTIPIFKYLLIVAASIAFNVSNIFAQSQNWWRTNGNTPGSSDFIGTTNNTSLIIKTNNTERLRINSNGKIGIGTTNPQYLLDVNGRVKIYYNVYCDSLLQCSNLKINTLSGNSNALLKSDAQGNIIRFNFSSNSNDVLTGDGNWTNINNIMPLSLWQSGGQNIFYTHGYVGIGTNNPLFNLDVIGDMRVSNNIYVGGGIVISDKVNAFSTVSTKSVMASEAKLNRMLADSILMDSTKVIYGTTTIKGDVKLENKLTIQGNTKFNGQFTSTQGMMFDGTHGLKYVSGSSGSPDYIVLGNVIGWGPPPVNPCTVPLILPSPVFHPGGWLQMYYNNTSLELITDGANSLIESKGNGKLLINYYCGKDVVIGNNSGGSVFANKDVLVNGNVGIGTNTPGYKLDVCGTVRSKEWIVSSEWCDFVFEPAYKKMNWKDKRDFHKVNKHLPYLPSGVEIEKDGLKSGHIKGLIQNIEEDRLDIEELFEKYEELLSKYIELLNKYNQIEKKTN